VLLLDNSGTLGRVRQWVGPLPLRLDAVVSATALRTLTRVRQQQAPDRPTARELDALLRTSSNQESRVSGARQPRLTLDDHFCAVATGTP